VGGVITLTFSINVKLPWQNYGQNLCSPLIKATLAIASVSSVWETGGKQWVSCHHHLRCSACCNNTCGWPSTAWLTSSRPLSVKSILKASFLKSFVNMTCVDSQCVLESHQALTSLLVSILQRLKNRESLCLFPLFRQLVANKWLFITDEIANDETESLQSDTWAPTGTAGNGEGVIGRGEKGGLMRERRREEERERETG
jgi:hypothetical protein